MKVRWEHCLARLVMDLENHWGHCLVLQNQALKLQVFASWSKNPELNISVALVFRTARNIRKLWSTSLVKNKAKPLYLPSRDIGNEVVNLPDRKAGPGELCTPGTVRNSFKLIYRCRLLQWSLWSLPTLSLQCAHYSVINLCLFYYILCILFEFNLWRSQV